MPTSSGVNVAASITGCNHDEHISNRNTPLRARATFLPETQKGYNTALKSNVNITQRMPLSNVRLNISAGMQRKEKGQRRSVMTAVAIARLAIWIDGAVQRYFNDGF